MALISYIARDLNTSYAGQPAVVEIILESHHIFLKMGRQFFKEISYLLD